jgi:murein endopeptidase
MAEVRTRCDELVKSEQEQNENELPPADGCGSGLFRCAEDEPIHETESESV